MGGEHPSSAFLSLTGARSRISTLMAIAELMRVAMAFPSLKGRMVAKASLLSLHVCCWGTVGARATFVGLCTPSRQLLTSSGTRGAERSQSSRSGSGFQFAAASSSAPSLSQAVVEACGTLHAKLAEKTPTLIQLLVSVEPYRDSISFAPKVTDPLPHENELPRATGCWCFSIWAVGAGERTVFQWMGRSEMVRVEGAYVFWYIFPALALKSPCPVASHLQFVMECMTGSRSRYQPVLLGGGVQGIIGADGRQGPGVSIMAAVLPGVEVFPTPSSSGLPPHSPLPSCTPSYINPVLALFSLSPSWTGNLQLVPLAPSQS